MNAPFNAGRGGSLRDPFTAFVCDDATAEMLRPIAQSSEDWAVSIEISSTAVPASSGRKE